MPPVLTNVILPPLITPAVRRDETGRMPVPHRHSFARIRDAIEVPKLIETQLESFKWFQREGLRELFTEISPIDDFTGKNLELSFGEYEFGEPRYNEFECRERDMTYAAPMRVKVRLKGREEAVYEAGEAYLAPNDLAGDFLLDGICLLYTSPSPRD